MTRQYLCMKLLRCTGVKGMPSPCVFGMYQLVTSKGWISIGFVFRKVKRGDGKESSKYSHGARASQPLLDLPQVESDVCDIFVGASPAFLDNEHQMLQTEKFHCHVEPLNFAGGGVDLGIWCSTQTHPGQHRDVEKCDLLLEA